jgi:hypothetical protein
MAIRTLKETLENQVNPSENGALITGQDLINGRQAARVL